MIILGIDPGLATLGYGVLEKDARGNVRAADYGVVLTPKEERLPTRARARRGAVGLRQTLRAAVRIHPHADQAGAHRLRQGGKEANSARHRQFIAPEGHPPTGRCGGRARGRAVPFVHVEAVVFIHDMILTFSFELTKEKVEILRKTPPHGSYCA